MHTLRLPTHDPLLRDLHDAVARLAEAVEDHPPVAAAIRRFGERLPPAVPLASEPLPPRPRPSRPVREVLYRALDEGTLDARRFDVLMLAENRAARAVRARRRLAHAATSRPPQL